MRKRSSLPLIALILCLVFGTLGLATQQAAKPEKMNKDQCLACHGPFEKVIALNLKFKVSEEETVNPHKYVPHDGKDAPECTECHTPHAIPPPEKAQIIRPNNVDFCYEGCHHMKNFQPCTTCH